MNAGIGALSLIVAPRRGVRRRRAATKPAGAEHPLDSSLLPGAQFQGAGFDRSRQARLFRQGAEGDLHRQRRRHSRRYQDDLFDDDDLHGERPPTPAQPDAAKPIRPRDAAKIGAASRGVGSSQRQASGRRRSRHRRVEDPDRHRRQRLLRQGAEQGLADRKRHAERQRQRHQGRQADLRLDDRRRRRSRPAAAGRVKGLFMPGSSGPGGDDKTEASK